MKYSNAGMNADDSLRNSNILRNSTNVIANENTVQIDMDTLVQEFV